ncbi:aminotransferase class I/II-fold pyridoxal phosphate-dependent enzyme [Pseudomonas sp. MWU13-2105]|uniref:aminotransferase class I/II-fold pyridoxal phosphate-dependent enzyme n=1 Tax=Pseudomonas sp. MWU13-2105 TaxID=2935074 RepID=UPI00200C500E|nr:aminotransferase class I/II-fold pyridoxal phosphate-dependent enzyme [Pseudomonas sp. MWU13-2105]
MKLADYSIDALDQLHGELQAEYLRLGTLKLSINMARGVPSAEQLDLSNPLLELSLAGDYRAEDGTDCRNYMGQQGLPEARRLFAPLLGVPAEQTVVSGNSSLALMYDCLAFAMLNGFAQSAVPWQQEPNGVAFLCPVPGYDRHFTLCATFGVRMIVVPLLDDGPDIALVRKLVAEDSSIRGMWCVPKYSNPTGTVYSDEVIEALASMPTAAADFRLFWDDAYTLHHLTSDSIEIANLYQACVRHEHPDRALVFASTSKMTFAGAGLALFGASKANVEWWLRHASVRSVGPDKLNQLRHVRYLKDLEGLKALMDGHRKLLAPRFAAVLKQLDAHLGSFGVASWSQPKGGYFISLNVLPGTARQTVALAQAVGVNLTAAGACYPHGDDPLDQHLRIAPSSPGLADLSIAAQVIGTCALLAACERLIDK